MIIRHFFTPGLYINSYLVFDESAKVGAVIDPTCNIDDYLACALKEGIKITDILETHVHADFVSGAAELKNVLHGMGTKATIHCSGLGGKSWVPAYADHIVEDQDDVQLGSLRLEAWHTPGHTPEHLIWVAYDGNRGKEIPQAVFTGDLLFVGSIGRPDLLGKEAVETLAGQLYHSLFDVLGKLPDFVEIYPAHGAGSLCGKGIGAGLSSTLGYERQCNPWLFPQEYDRWFRSLQLEPLPIPRYFPYMKTVNVTGNENIETKKAPEALSKDQLKSFLLKGIVIDTRRPDEFAAGSFPKSINIPFAPAFSLWAGAVLPPNSQLILVIDDPEQLPSILQSLRLVGFDNIIGTVDVSQWNFFDKKEWLVSSPVITAKELQKEKEKFYILDVRTDKEWKERHIEGAHHLELVQAAQKLLEVPTDKPIAVICHSGNRASIVASLLKKECDATVFNVKGGMQAWIKMSHEQ